MEWRKPNPDDQREEIEPGEMTEVRDGTKETWGINVGISMDLGRVCCATYSTTFRNVWKELQSASSKKTQNSSSSSILN